MKLPILIIFLLIAMPTSALALEQSFTQQGFKTSIKLSPDRPEPHSEVHLQVSLSKDGNSITDKDVTLEVYERDAARPLFRRPIDLLDGDYVDSWQFENAGDYKLVIRIADHDKPGDLLRYEINAGVADMSKDHSDDGFFAHHFGGGHWGWWGAGLMVIMMVPMMVFL